MPSIIYQSKSDAMLAFDPYFCADKASLTPFSDVMQG
jgi:hypothetical protein